MEKKREEKQISTQSDSRTDLPRPSIFQSGSLNGEKTLLLIWYNSM